MNYANVTIKKTGIQITVSCYNGEKVLLVYHQDTDILTFTNNCIAVKYQYSKFYVHFDNVDNHLLLITDDGKVFLTSPYSSDKLLLINLKTNN